MLNKAAFVRVYIMRQKLTKLILFTVLSLSQFFSYIETSAAENLPYVMCRNKKLVRTIRIENIPDGCRTLYTKMGVDSVVGSAKNRTSCDSFLANVRKNLEGADWKCKEVSSAVVSDGTKK